MTPKERRQEQHAREAMVRNETEADIAGFKTGQTASRPTELSSTKKSKKNASRCFGCDASGFPLQVWEYHDVAAGPSLLCADCSQTAEAAYRGKQKSVSAARSRLLVTARSARRS